MQSEPEYIDLWLVERILKDNHLQEINWLQAQLDKGLRIKNDNNRYVTSNLEVLRQRMNDPREDLKDGEMFLETG